MNKKNKVNDSIDKWSDAINKSWDRQREIDNKLSPSKGQIRYVVDYSREINKRAAYIEYTSLLAHEGLMDFEKAQQIINLQKDEMVKSMEYLKAYLAPDEEDK